MRRAAVVPSLRARMRAGDTLYGLIIKMPAGAVVEMSAQAGFDFAVLDCEHGGAETGALEDHVRAAESFGLPALVRVGDHAPIGILRALDTGAEGIVVPHVREPEDVAAIVRAAHYPPVGNRGLATSTRAGGHGLTPLVDHLSTAAENTVVVLQIEDREALVHVSAMASSAHVDAVFVGPTDLSISLGHPGNLDHPEVMAAIDGIIGAVSEADHTVLGAFARDEGSAAKWRERGAHLIALSSTGLFAQKLAEVASELHR